MASAPKTTFDRAAAEYLLVLGRRKGVGQLELGRKTGIPEATIGRYWRGDSAMTLGTLVKIIDALGVTHAEAFEEIDRIEVALKKSEGK